MYGALAFLQSIFAILLAPASTALLAEEIACELMAEESDPLGLDNHPLVRNN